MSKGISMERVEEIIDSYGCERRNVIAIMQDIQAEYKYLSQEVLERIAEKLKSLASHKQVLCVTHLPQLAALADTHMLIAKSEHDGRTYTTVTPLDRKGRAMELARIIGGTNITETTLKSAEEMLLSGQ